MEWNEYPKGTKAYSIMGGYWIKTTEAGKYGWKWFCGATFPTPGGDASRIELPDSNSIDYPTTASTGSGSNPTS